jgi:hypothetical protein
MFDDPFCINERQSFLTMNQSVLLYGTSAQKCSTNKRGYQVKCCRHAQQGSGVDLIIGLPPSQGTRRLRDMELTAHYLARADILNEKTICKG